MSFKDGEMHTLAAIGACVLSAALGGGLYVYSGEAKAATKSEPELQDLEAIEASIATHRKPQKLPQKEYKEAPPEQQPDKVSRTADKLPDPPKDKPNEPKIDPNDPLKNVPRREVDDDDKPIGKPTDAAGAFNPDERGFAEETKGHPFLQRVARDINDAWDFPKISSAAKGAVGCLHIGADGKIVKTKIDQSGEPDLDLSAEQALKKVETKRNNNPEPVPDDIAKLATTRWICFKFNPQSRSD
jgi:hypothetical protein